MKSRLLLKRLIDVIGGAVLLLLTSPLLLLASAAVALTIGRPTWFRQLRSGLNGKPFQICKLRTMKAGSPRTGCISDHDHERLTRLGRLLRRTSVDELPQFLNVLRGDIGENNSRRLSQRM